MQVTVFGLGEAGGAIARDLVTAGAEVHAYDPSDVATPTGVRRHDDPNTAVANADIVCALTTAADSLGALRQALVEIPRSAIYADFCTSAAGLKLRLGAVAEAAGLRFADVALMAPVPGTGLRTPVLASGPGAARFIELMAPLGMPMEHAGTAPGDAAVRKLLRSVVIKGLAALVIESLHAAEAAGLADETWANLVDQFTAADESFLRRIVDGTYPHARRRLHEMEATSDLLDELGVGSVMTRATVQFLAGVNDGAAKVTLPDRVGTHRTRASD